MHVVNYLLTVAALFTFIVTLWHLGIPYIIAASAVLGAYIFGFLNAEEVYRRG